MNGLYEFLFNVLIVSVKSPDAMRSLQGILTVQDLQEWFEDYADSVSWIFEAFPKTWKEGILNAVTQKHSPEEVLSAIRDFAKSTSDSLSIGGHK